MKSSNDQPGGRTLPKHRTGTRESRGNALDLPEQGLVELAVGVFRQQRALDRVGSDRTAAVTEGEIITVQAVFLLDQYAGPFLKTPARRAGSQQFGEAVGLEEVAEPEFGVTGDPAVALRHIAEGVDADEFLGAVFPPDAGQAAIAGDEIIDQPVEGADSSAKMPPSPVGDAGGPPP